MMLKMLMHFLTSLLSVLIVTANSQAYSHSCRPYESALKKLVGHYADAPLFQELGLTLKTIMPSKKINENLAESDLLKPSSIIATITAPERETPGMTAAD